MHFKYAFAFLRFPECIFCYCVIICINCMLYIVAEMHFCISDSSYFISSDGEGNI